MATWVYLQKFDHRMLIFNGDISWESDASESQFSRIHKTNYITQNMPEALVYLKSSVS